MYGNIDAALLYFGSFTEYTTDENGSYLVQSLSDPCVFFKNFEIGRTLAIVVVYVNDCVITGHSYILLHF